MTKTLQQISKTISQSHRILLHLHPNPDFDSAGSTLAFYHWLKSLGKDVHLINGDSDRSSKFSILPGHEFIEKLSFSEVNLVAFDLFIILDSADLSRVSQLMPIVFPKSLKTINIDHHQDNPSYCDINLIEGQKSSTCEIVFDIFNSLKIPITSEMAICLYLGIYDDTKGFHNLNTTPTTMAVAAKLTKINPDFLKFIRIYERTTTPENVKFVALALTHLKEYFNGQVAISSLSYQNLIKANVLADQSQKSWIAEYLQTVPNYLITISLAEFETDISGISLRSADPKWDVAKIASLTGRGGGHTVASGATINQSASESLNILLDIIQETYPELGKP